MFKPSEVKASRFAVLKDDDPTDWVPAKTGKRTQGGPSENGKSSKTRTKPPKDDDHQLRELAFGQLGKKAAKKKNKAKGKANNLQPSDGTAAGGDEGRSQSGGVVDGEFHRDLEEAVLLSQLQEEEQRQWDLQNEPSPQGKKPVKMSLEQFHKMDDRLRVNGSSDAAKAYLLNGDLFRNAEETTRQILQQERKLDSSRKERTMSGEGALLEEWKSTVSEKDLEIAQLKVQNEALVAEMKKVKFRYKTIRGILEDAEMKEKAEILADVVRLNKERNDLSEDVKTLSCELQLSENQVAILTKQLRQATEKQQASSAVAK